MLNIDEYSYFLKKSTNFASKDNFEKNWSIIEETLQLHKHKMLMGEANFNFFYDQELQELEMADLTDFWEYESSYGRDKKR